MRKMVVPALEELQGKIITWPHHLPKGRRLYLEEFESQLVLEFPNC